MAKGPVCGFALEEAARKHGALRIAGLDEVGRGPLFGPVVAAAVILGVLLAARPVLDWRQRRRMRAVAV